MALSIKDRIYQETETQGIGTITLGNVKEGFQEFTALPNGSETYYCITNNTDWEVGQGQYVSDGTTDTLSRELLSSSTGALIDLKGGSSVFCTYPAEKGVLRDWDGNIYIPDADIEVNNVKANDVEANDVEANKFTGDGSELTEINAEINNLVPEAPLDNLTYARNNKRWINISDSAGIPDAPFDGLKYARRDGEWTEVEAASGVPIVEGDYLQTIVYSGQNMTPSGEIFAGVWRYENATEVGLPPLEDKLYLTYYDITDKVDDFATNYSVVDTIYVDAYEDQGEDAWEKVKEGDTIDMVSKLGAVYIVDNIFKRVSGTDVFWEIWVVVKEDCCGIPDAPIDGKEYARKDAEWIEVEGGLDGYTKAEIDAQQNAQDTAIVENTNDITENNDNIARQQIEITNNSDNITKNDTAINKNILDISSNTTAIGTLSGQVGQNTEDIAELQNSIFFTSAYSAEYPSAPNRDPEDGNMYLQNVALFTYSFAAATQIFVSKTDESGNVRQFTAVQPGDSIVLNEVNSPNYGRYELVTIEEVSDSYVVMNVIPKLGQGTVITGAKIAFQAFPKVGLWDENESNGYGIYPNNLEINGGVDIGSAANGKLSNTMLGRNASGQNAGASAINNVSVGDNAFAKMSGAKDSVAVGSQAMKSMVSGSNNTAIGSRALSLNPDGKSNVAIGAFAGATLAGGDNNILIGDNAAPSAPTVSNEITLGNDDTTVLRMGNGDIVYPASGGGGGYTPEPMVWEDVVSERAFDTVYTNTNDVPLYVQFYSNNTAPTYTQMYIDGNIFGAIGNNADVSYSTNLFIVPAGSTYELRLAGGTLSGISVWNEARMPVAVGTGGGDVQPAVVMQGTISSGSYGVTPNVWVPITIDSTEYDTNDCLDTATGRYIPNVEGYYLVNSATSVMGTDLTRAINAISLNGTRVAQGSFEYDAVTAMDTIDSRGTTIVYCNGTTDYISMELLANGTAITLKKNTGTQFSVSLITGQSSGGSEDSLWTEVDGKAIYLNDVGIGTSTPTFESGTGLEIKNASTLGGHLKLTDSASTAGGTGGFDLYSYNTNGYIENYEGGTAETIFRNNGDQSMSINSSNQVEIEKDLTVNGVTVGQGSGTGISNTAVGSLALNANNTGTQNTAIGTSALLVTEDAVGNTAVGDDTLRASKGAGNTAVGINSGRELETGINNTFIGRDSGRNSVSGSNNTCVGNEAKPSAVDVSNEAVIGNNDVTRFTTVGGRFKYIIGASYNMLEMKSKDNSQWLRNLVYDNGANSIISSGSLALQTGATVGMTIGNGSVSIPSNIALQTFSDNIVHQNLPTTATLGNIYVEPSNGRLYRSTATFYSAQEVDGLVNAKDAIIEKLSARLDALEKRVK